MRKLLLVVPLGLAILLAACSGGGAEDKGKGSATATPAPAGQRGPAGLPGPVEGNAFFADLLALPTPSPAPAPAGALQVSTTALDLAQRKVISTASLSMEVEEVPTVITDVRTIAESLGGFLEQLSSSGDPERQRANMTIRVPQDRFFTALERIELLGKVLGQNVGSQDVSEQFIDLEARLKSALREEQSFLSLLEKAESVGDVLAIERELARVRSEIERLQGQLNFLERRVALATISVSLFPPAEEIAEPPAASLAVAVSDVSATVDEVRGLVATLDGVIDATFLSVRDGEERATVILRVFSPDFDQAMASLQGQGEVTGKEVRRSGTVAGGEVGRREKPDARIDLSLTEREGEPFPVWAIVLASVLPVVLVSALGFLAYRTARGTRSRG